MNRYDSDLVAGEFRREGWAMAEDPSEADVVALNTCSVRGGAEDRVYGRLGELKRWKRRNPKLVVAVLGCQAQREGADLLRRAPHVDLVVGTREFQRLPELVRRVQAGDSPILAIDESSDVKVERTVRADRSPSAFVAVMRGCDLHCTFCIVPRTRGRVRSRTMDDIVEEVRWLVADGVREVTLLGQTVNAYGYDLASPTEAEALGYRKALTEGGAGVPPYAASPAEPLVLLGEGSAAPRLANLVRRLGTLPGLDRIRLVTNHVAYLDGALIDAMADVNSAVAFLPVPLQHGSDRILRAMRRGYTVELYRRRIDALRARVPGIELSSDWIVGYPGETEEDFEKSCQQLREIGFAQNFVFKYSPRPDTPAFPLPPVDAATVARRHKELLSLAEEVQAARWRRYEGSTQAVLVERTVDGRLSGRTPQNLEVFFEGAETLVGEIVDVLVESTTAHSARGTLARRVPDTP